MKRTGLKALGLSCLCLVLTVTALCAQTIEFNTVYPNVVEARLHRLEKDNSKREGILHALFEESGCDGDRLVEQTVKGSRIPNVICTLQGAEDSWIVVGAHFDKDIRSAEGAIDNWSGASLLPSLFESLASQPRRYTFVFIGFSDEERGLVGSRFYVSQLSKEQRSKVRAMVNIDSVGLASTKVWVSRADKELLALLGHIADVMKFPVNGVSVDNVGDTDSHHFVRSKIPVIDFHSITQQTLELLHSPRDTVSAIRLDDYYTTYRLLTAYLAFLDLKLDPPGAPQDSR